VSAENFRDGTTGVFSRDRLADQPEGTAKRGVLRAIECPFASSWRPVNVKLSSESTAGGVVQTDFHTISRSELGGIVFNLSDVS
jgi:hypothetical protein